ncbi:helix-turn-helix transcriptional regulator [Amycolatopsis sp. 195334CR]|uniref:helix-turn-helix transcriptional regulator n=1 Tax=Amycolatopsis sp. 195334CR TaxID=2814588 RepID=UPI001A8E665E|nr:helix-turn-helix transcriptional regulator [Amycolatopsis sp. 195334CR]MBN6037047.1 helix-turn-helix transcriptional regulator [Amycolatopsis sp. 195334CR]
MGVAVLTRGNRELTALLATATSEVLVLSTGSLALARPREIDRYNLRRGVAYRVLCPGEFALPPGAEIRTAPEVPTDALVVDRRFAVLPAERNGFAVFELPGVIGTTVELFERIWAVSAPRGEELPSERERELLALLSSGITDESAALRLGVSVRTVRRTAADLMLRLGARSRFQAGARAADRGWLPAGVGEAAHLVVAVGSPSG